MLQILLYSYIQIDEVKDEIHTRKRNYRSKVSKNKLVNQQEQEKCKKGWSWN